MFSKVSNVHSVVLNRSILRYFPLKSFDSCLPSIDKGLLFIDEIEITITGRSEESARQS